MLHINHVSIFSYLWYNLVYLFTSNLTTAAFSIRMDRPHPFPKKGPVLVVANHQSFLDPPAICLALGRRLVYLARKSLFRNSFFASVIRGLDAVPIDQDGVGKEGIRTILEELGNGKAVLVFPEGSRTPDGQVHPFRPGIHLLIKKSKALIVPVGIAGAYEAWPIWRKYPLPAPLCLPDRDRAIGVAVGKAIHPDTIAHLPREDMLALLAREVHLLKERAEHLRGKK